MRHRRTYLLALCTTACFISAIGQSCQRLPVVYRTSPDGTRSILYLSNDIALLLIGGDHGDGRLAVVRSRYTGAPDYVSQTGDAVEQRLFEGVTSLAYSEDERLLGGQGYDSTVMDLDAEPCWFLIDLAAGKVSKFSTRAMFESVIAGRERRVGLVLKPSHEVFREIADRQKRRHVSPKER